MNILSRLLEQSSTIFLRDLDSSTPQGFAYLFGGSLTASGKNVGANSALSLNAVYQAVNLISSDSGSLPYIVYKPTSTGKEITEEHNIYRLLNFEPNYYQTAIEFHTQMAVNRLMYGNAYAIIERFQNSAQIKNLIPVHPDNVETIVDVDKELFYKIKGIKSPISHYNICHIKDLSIENGNFKAKSRIEYCKETLGRGIAIDDYTSYFFSNGANVGMVIESEIGSIDTPEQRLSLTNSINNKYSGSENSHKHLVLPSGFKLSNGPTKFNQEQTQFIQTKIHLVEEVARMFNIPLNKMRMSTDGNSYNSVEQANIEYVTDCLRPFMKSFEQEYSRKLFGTYEKGILFTKASLESRLRGDMASQTNHVSEMLGKGVYSINQALSFLGQNQIGPEGDVRYVQSNQMLVGQTGIQQNKDNGKKNI